MEAEKNQNDLVSMNRHLARIDKALNSPWRAFLRGTFQGLGSIVGAAIVLVVIGWVLNQVGVIPAFRDYVADFKVMIDDFRGR